MTRAANARDVDEEQIFSLAGRMAGAAK